MSGAIIMSSIDPTRSSNRLTKDCAFGAPTRNNVAHFGDADADDARSSLLRMRDGWRDQGDTRNHQGVTYLVLLSFARL